MKVRGYTTRERQVVINEIYCRFVLNSNDINSDGKLSPRGSSANKDARLVLDVNV